MIWRGRGDRLDVMHERSKFRISIHETDYPRDYVQKLHDIVHPLVTEAHKKGVPRETLHKSARHLQAFVGDPEAFEQEAERHYRRWMAIAAEGSPLELYTKDGRK